MIRHISDLRYPRQGNKSGEQRRRVNRGENWMLRNEMLRVNSAAACPQQRWLTRITIVSVHQLYHFPPHKQYFLRTQNQLFPQICGEFYDESWACSEAINVCWVLLISPHNTHNSKYWCYVLFTQGPRVEEDKEAVIVLWGYYGRCWIDTGVSTRFITRPDSETLNLYLSANRRPVSRSCDHSGPIRAQTPRH